MRTDSTLSQILASGRTPQGTEVINTLLIVQRDYRRVNLDTREIRDVIKKREHQLSWAPIVLSLS